MDEYETNRIKSLITLYEQIIEDKKNNSKKTESNGPK